MSAVRVLLTTSGAAGHFLPLVPFARACLTAGHDVRVAAQRSRGAIVGRAGLAFVPSDDRPPEQWGRVMSTLGTLSSDEANVRIVSEAFGRIDTRTALPGCSRRSRPGGRTSCSARAPSSPGGPAAHERSPRPGRRARGLAVDGPPLRGRAGPRAAPLPDWWEDAGDPLVYVTFGSVVAALSYFPSLYRATIDALAPLPVRLLVTIGNDRDPAELGAVPANVHVERWVPQETVAHHAAAVVCHGGYGTTLGAMGQGLPLVVVPLQSADQWHNARRVGEIGAGIALTGDRDGGRLALDDPGPAVISALPNAVRRVLDDPGYRLAAHRIAAEMAALPPVDDAAGVLEALTVTQVGPLGVAERQ